MSCMTENQLQVLVMFRGHIDEKTVCVDIVKAAGGPQLW